MRICLISSGPLGSDPRAVALAESLTLAGHEVVGVSPADNEPGWVITPRSGRRPRLRPRRELSDRLASLAAGTGSDLFQPTHPKTIVSAETAASKVPSSAVLVQPSWPRPGLRDLIDLAPHQPTLSKPASRSLPLHHIPGYEPPAETEALGRLLIVYRKTVRSPGRYLENALRRLGLEVSQREELDWSQVDPTTRAVVIVESPLPAFAIRGTNPGVPVVYWVHHGEHHVDMNARLQRKYGVHLVLLAHSWHLAHRFTRMVDRLPFGVAAELFDPEFRPFSDRTNDVAFVGARSNGDHRHEMREDLLSSLERELGTSRVKVESQISPEEMAHLYRDSRIVIDDGTGKHFPITMRVFEATGGGALLATTAAPGMDLMFEEGSEFRLLGANPVNEIVEQLAESPETLAIRGHERAWNHHTYDVRAIELIATLDRLNPADLPKIPAMGSPTGLGAVADRFSDAQRILDLGDETAGHLPGREVWGYRKAEDRAEPGTFQLAVIATGTEDERKRAVAAARLGVITPLGLADEVAPIINQIHGRARRSDMTDGTVFTFGNTGYRVSSDPDPA